MHIVSCKSDQAFHSRKFHKQDKKLGGKLDGRERIKPTTRCSYLPPSTAEARTTSLIRQTRRALFSWRRGPIPHLSERTDMDDRSGLLAGLTDQLNTADHSISFSVNELHNTAS